MILGESLDAVARVKYAGGVRQPLYDTWCFSRLPASVQHALLGDSLAEALPAVFWKAIKAPVDEVILFYVDAFGWDQYLRHLPTSPFLKRFESEGVIAQLTSEFPSTTAAHMTTMHTGLTPVQSGIFEWFYFEPAADAVIAPLPFSYAGDKQSETLRAAGLDAGVLLKGATFYEQLAANGVASRLYFDARIARSTYSQAMNAGATAVPYRTFAEMLTRLERERSMIQGPAYHFVYFDPVDTLSHDFGPGSPEVAAEIRAFWLLLENLFEPAMQRQGRRTLVLIASDHGQIAVDPACPIYLNERVPKIGPLLRTSRAGKPIVPGGSPRDFFIYVRDGALDEAEATLKNELGEIADVRRTSELVAQGVFGPGKPHPKFRDRIGDLVILGRGNGTVWWHEPGRFELTKLGRHGGSSREEIEIPLLAMVVGP